MMHYVQSVGGWLVAVPLALVLLTLAVLTAWAAWNYKAEKESDARQEAGLHIKHIEKMNGKKEAAHG